MLLLLSGIPVAAVGLGLRRTHEGWGVALVVLSGLLAGFICLRSGRRWPLPIAAAFLVAAGSGLLVLGASIDLLRDGWDAACSSPYGPVCLDAALRVAGVFPVLFGAVTSGAAVVLLAWLALRVNRS